MLGFTPQAGSDLNQDALKTFTQKTGIDVELIPTLGTSAEQTALLSKFLARKATTPDVYLIDVIWPGTLHEDLLDLTPYLDEESRRHLPALLKNATIQGRVTALPFYMNTGLLYYRADLLKKYGYSAPPAGWSELARMALRIQQGERLSGKKDFWGYIWQGGEYEGLTCNALEWQASFGGGHIIEADGRVSVNNRQTVEAMNMAAGWVGSISPRGVLSYTESDSLNVFSSGNAAFMRHWSSGFRSIQQGLREGVAGVAPLPAGGQGRAHTIGGFHLAVSRYTEHPREAAALVLYLTGIEVESRRATERGYIPTYPHLYDSPALAQALPQTRALRELRPDSLIMRPSTIAGSKYGDVSKAYYQGVHSILERKIRADAGLAAIEKNLTSVMSTIKQRL